MFGFRFIKVQPTTYLLVYRDGQIKREGLGLSLFYFAPTTSLVSIPTESTEYSFIFKEITSDYQEVSVQGQLTYRIAEPSKVSQMLNYTLNAAGAYTTDDPQKLSQRLINHLQVITRAQLQNLSLRQALQASDELTDVILQKTRNLLDIQALGVEILSISIIAIKPNPETARALETEVRENLLKEADLAVYARRNSAVEQERAIKENELSTELAVELKKRQIKEAAMDAQIAVQEKQHAMALAEIESKIASEERNKELFQLSSENSRIAADAKAYEMSALLKHIKELDSRQLEVLAMKGMDSGQLIAQAFSRLSENANKIGELNVSPDLLGSLLQSRKN